LTEWQFLWDLVHDSNPFRDIGSTVLFWTTVITISWQLLPIPGKPLSWLIGYIGRAMNRDLIEKVEKIERRVDSMDRDSKQEKAERARTRILSFNDEILNNIRHSRRMFENVLDDITLYKHYCEDNPDFQNDKTHEAEENIKRVYRNCLEQHDFL